MMKQQYGNCAKCNNVSVLLDLNKDDICIDCRLDAIDHQTEIGR